MDCDEFTHRLLGLTADEIRRVAAVLRADLETPDGEVAWWKATIDVTGALRRQRRSREASLAAHKAATAVQAAAGAAGLDTDADRDDITAVARAAAEAARVLVAGDAACAGEPLLHPWSIAA